MNRLFVGLSLAVMAVAPVAAWADEAPVDSQMHLKVQAKQRVMGFAKELKTTLKQGIQTGGVESAIALCNVQAPAIASRRSAEQWTVARTSLKARNLANQPDEWERQVLQSFEDRLKAGESIAKLEASTFSTSSTAAAGGEYRYMKAIPTSKVCLACHGSNISGGVAAKLEQLYPEDRATGFAVGDIRGAFSLRKSLSKAQP